MTALEKQIQASEKRVAKYEKNVGMYRDRADKKLAMLQKNGFMVTREDFTITKSERWKYDYDYTVSDRVKEMLNFVQWSPVIDNMLQERENEDRLENERKIIEELTRKQQDKVQEADRQKSTDALLIQQLTKALAPFRDEWKRQMMEWHAKFFDRIHEMLPNAREQYNSLQKEIDLQLHQNGFRPTPKITQLEAARASFGRIISAPPAAYSTKEDYLAKTEKNLEREFDDNISVLASKCRKFELDADKLQVYYCHMAERGFDMFLTDGKDRVVDARMIWAAEYSEYVSPHTRYIVTERNIRRMDDDKQMNQNNINKEYTMTEDNWKERIDWQAFKENLVGERKNEKLWAMGSTGTDEDIHWQNYERLSDEIKAIDEGQYELLLDFYDKSVFMDYMKPVGEKKAENQVKDNLMMDALTDIALYTGWKRIEFDDSKERTLTLQGWAREFADTHAATDWEQADYMELVDNFAEQKVQQWIQMHPVKPSYADIITDINVYSGRDGSMFIRCKINGEQQSAKKLNIWDTQTFNDRTDRMALASRYFMHEMQNSENQGKGMKR